MALLWLWAAVIAFGVVGIGILDGWWPAAAMVAGLIVAAVLTFAPRWFHKEAHHG